MSAPRGVCSRGGVCSGGGISQHALRQTPLPPVDKQMPVKILPWPNFVAAGKYQVSHCEGTSHTGSLLRDVTK